jgi:hypothetical protein
MKTLAEVSEVDSLYYFLKQSIRQLQQLHKTGTSHGGIEPLTIGVESPYPLLEGSLVAMYAAPEVALGLAVAEHYTSEEAVKLWKKDSSGLQLLERWIPGVAEGYSISVLQKLIGTPMPEQQSDIWSLGISYLSIYDTLSKEESFPEKDSFFETLTCMLRLRGRSLPIFEETSSIEPAVTVAPRSGRMTLSEPIRHGERNKTRRNPHN